MAVRRALVLVAALLAVTLQAAPAAAAPTNWVDPTFGPKAVTIDVGPGGEHATDLVVQPDGKVVVLATVGLFDKAMPTSSEVALLRLHPDGRLDTTFGDG